MSMGMVLTECLVYGSFFNKSFSNYIFEVGTPKIENFGFFSKNRSSKFLPTRKNMVFVLPVFSKSGGNVAYFGGSALNCFFTKVIHIVLVYKNSSHRGKLVDFLIFVRTRKTSHIVDINFVREKTCD